MSKIVIADQPGICLGTDLTRPLTPILPLSIDRLGTAQYGVKENLNDTKMH